jgi:hypothetical protein
MPTAGHSNVSVNGSAGGDGHSQKPSSATCVEPPEYLVDRQGVIPGPLRGRLLGSWANPALRPSR